MLARHLAKGKNRVMKTNLSLTQRSLIAALSLSFICFATAVNRNAVAQGREQSVTASSGSWNNSTASPTSTLESQPEKKAIGANDFPTFWKKFKSAVIAGDKATVAEMTKFPLSMPYGVKAVKNKEDFLRRYNEIFKGEANAAQCFASAEPRKESDQRYEIYCPFKETPKDKENAPIRFEFELTKGGWRFVGLDNINE
jgi:aminopeptidase N